MLTLRKTTHARKRRKHETPTRTHFETLTTAFELPQKPRPRLFNYGNEYADNRRANDYSRPTLSMIFWPRGSSPEQEVCKASRWTPSHSTKSEKPSRWCRTIRTKTMRSISTSPFLNGGMAFLQAQLGIEPIQFRRLTKNHSDYTSSCRHRYDVGILRRDAGR